MKKNKFTAIALPFRVKVSVLAVGSQSKNTVCFVKGSYAYISAVRADLADPRDFSLFEKDVRYFLKQKPKLIAYDLHPEYQSTKYALSLPTTYYLLPTQHHHAHIVSCMVDNGLKNQKVIGVAFDGTGMGSDDKLWGAEFLIVDYKSSERVAHLKEVPLLGGQQAIKEPWRLVAWWLSRVYKDNFFELDIDWTKKIDRKKWQVLKKLSAQGFNSPLASSMGRLFDAAGSLILGKQNAEFEAALAIELQKLAASYPSTALGAPFGRKLPLGCARGSLRSQDAGYPFHIFKEKEARIIDPTPLFKELVRDLKAHTPKEEMAYRFHVTVSQMIAEMCVRLRKQFRINSVVLSGGVFQNTLLLKMSLALLYKRGFKVWRHRFIACSDAGISLGQAAIVGYSR